MGEVTSKPSPEPPPPDQSAGCVNFGESTEKSIKSCNAVVYELENRKWVEKGVITAAKPPLQSHPPPSIPTAPPITSYIPLQSPQQPQAQAQNGRGLGGGGIPQPNPLLGHAPLDGYVDDQTPEEKML